MSYGYGHMSSPKPIYVPPHLRNKQVAQGSQEPQPAPRFESGVGHRFGSSNRSMSRSKSVPIKMNEVTDEEVRALFDANLDNPDFQVYDSAKVEVTAVERIDPLIGFPGSGIRNELLKSLASLGFKSPTAVQKYSIPYVFHGDDVMVTSQTGSGKTAAYMLPVITKILSEASHTNHPKAVALVPTRELALQIKTETDKFCSGTDIHTVCLFGGANISDQLHRLRSGYCDILIATPGRLIDIMDRHVLSLQSVKYLILDEADRMLDMGFEPQISQVINGYDMPPVENRQSLLFSATFPKTVQLLARDYMKPNLTRIAVGMQQAPSLIVQRFVYVPENSKFSALLDYIHSIDGPTLVFAERKVSVDNIEEFLFDQGEAVVAIHGSRDMADRLGALRGFTNGRAKIMVATDVAARGIDIPNVLHVINLDLPSDLDSYIHRIGRTGRAGKEGYATSFFNENNAPVIHDLINHFRSHKMEVPEALVEFERESRTARRPAPRSNRGGRQGMVRDRSYNNMSSRY